MRRGVTPDSSSCRRLAAARSMCPLPCPPKLRRHFRPHLVAALADAGTDGRVQILRRACRSAPRMAATAAAAMPRRRAAPSGVHRGHRAAALIHQQHGDAVGGLHRDDAARRGFRAARRPRPAARRGPRRPRTKRNGSVSAWRAARRRRGYRRGACRSRAPATEARRVR